MKKVKKIISFLLAIAIMFSMGGSNAFAAELVQEENKQIKKYEVYNGNGEVIFEAENLEDVENYIAKAEENGRNAKSVFLVAKTLIKSVDSLGKILLGALTIYQVNQVMAQKSDISSIIELHYPISKLQEIVNNTETVYVYSSSGLVSNPYPPNSYQGTQWYKTNFYCVVGVAN